MDAEKIEKLGTKKIWAVDGELYLWEFAKCSDSYSPKSGTTIVEFERRWSTCISTVRYTRQKIDFFKMDRGVPIGIGAKKLREVDQLV